MTIGDIRFVIDKAAPELRAAGLSALYLFGSQARGENTEDSDVDLAFDLRDDARFSLVDQARLQLRLQELLQKRVDFVSRNGMRPRMRQRVETEMVRLL